MSPELDVKVREGGDDIIIGTTYEIVNVENVVTEVSAYNGVRVQLMSKKAEEGNVMLWKRPITTPKSKLGAFIELLGLNTDEWLHKWIVFTDWRAGARIIELAK